MGYKGTGDCFKKIAAEEGLAKGLYKGFLATSSAALAVLWSSSCTIVRRCTSVSEPLVRSPFAGAKHTCDRAAIGFACIFPLCMYSCGSVTLSYFSEAATSYLSTFAH